MKPLGHMVSEMSSTVILGRDLLAIALKSLAGFDSERNRRGLFMRLGARQWKHAEGGSIF